MHRRTVYVVSGVSSDRITEFLFSRTFLSRSSCLESSLGILEESVALGRSSVACLNEGRGATSGRSKDERVLSDSPSSHPARTIIPEEEARILASKKVARGRSFTHESWNSSTSARHTMRRLFVHV
ncbi:hypothetical protein EAG_09856 [Camponotus floridanus]|uniref:Uncharacterized protein n=1 Tax=Camponotus floridanus TaxID=104421 RepID=E1ZX50_CAMFO|nr:hypothetical protein EAG_09856 [Camponotus floridanus]